MQADNSKTCPMFSREKGCRIMAHWFVSGSWLPGLACLSFHQQYGFPANH